MPPLSSPIAPQLARSASALPVGDEWVYEPKLDGFRALAFIRAGEPVSIVSRSGRPLDRYFPELAFEYPACVLDGEIIIGDIEGRQDFEALQSRLHPAESRVLRLSREIPATFVAFDLLEIDGDSLLETPFEERRAHLEELVAVGDGVVTPLTASADEATRWLTGSEGVIAKERYAVYRPGERRGMVKIKRIRTMDAIVVGYRHGKETGTIGSLILGAYDGETLRVVGHTSGFSAKQKRELRDTLAPFETGERGTGAPSRWSAGRDLDWVELRPELVAEVRFDHVSAGRIRHGAKLVRFRDDKQAHECRVDQLEG